MTKNQQTDNELVQIRRDKLQDLVDEGADPHKITKYDVTAYAGPIHEEFDEYEGKEVSMAGRIMAKRGHGKILFLDLQDSTGQIQLIARLNIMGEDAFPPVKKLDIGDIVGCKGEVMKSNRGEISISVKEVTLLTKSLKPLPEKFHGLKDVDLRYRERYLDLIMNPEVKDVFVKRTEILSAIRSYLDGQGFLEVETPILNTISGGATARPFITHHNSLNIDMYLRIANELYLKRLIVGGFDKVYEMGRMFRNEGMDAKHNPEYTGIELYQAYTDYEGMMELTEDLVSTVCQEVNGTMKVNYQGTEIDFKPPWKRMTMTDAVKQYSGVDFSNIRDDEEAKALADEHEIDYQKTDGWGKILSLFFDKYCEDEIIQPTFIYEYPVEISPLAKRSPNKPEMTDRFEAFVNGSEIGNAFSELNDAQDQRARFEHQVALRQAGDEEAGMMDEDFINALEIGLPPTGGLGLGIDRIVMLLTDQPTIRDVLLFPTMKPLEEEKAENEVGKGNNDDRTQEVEQEFEELDLSKVQVEPLFEEEITFDDFTKADFRAVKVLACEEIPKSRKLLKFTLDDGSGEDRVILSGIKNYYQAEDLVGKTLLAITNIPARKMMGIDSEGMLLSTTYEYDGEEKLDLIVLPNHIPAGAKVY